MALSRVKTWVAGEVLTAADLENEFNNIINNGFNLVQPWVGTFDLNGNTLILDGDADTSIDAATDDTIDFNISGADDFRMTANTFTALSGSSVTIESGTLAVTVGNVTMGDGDLTVNNPGAHTNSVATPVTIGAVTSGTPAAGIGTGIVFQSESQDENPSNFGQLEFAATDIGTGTEDTYFQVLTRVAGAALTATYRWIATGAFKAIFTHANTADRTYTLPDSNWDFFSGTVFKGPSSIGSGSTRSLETFTSADINPYSGIHFYDGAVTLSNGHTLTCPAGRKRIIIISNTSITINGTITAAGAGGEAGAAGPGGGTGNGGNGGPGTDQPGGVATGGGSVGYAIINGCYLTGGTGQITGSDCGLLANPLGAMGGGGGAGASGDGGGTGGGAGGAGGGSIVLIAPSVTLAATAVLNTSGSNGGNGTAGFTNGGGGGGGGNVYIITRSYTDSGATFTMTGGSGGSGNVSGSAGQTGVKQILIYS